MSLELGIEMREADGVAVLDVSGILARGPACETLLERVKAVLEAGKRKVVLNLAELTFFDSIGMSTLMKSVIAAEERGAELRVVRPREMSPAAWGTGPLELCADEEEALNSFVSPPLQ